MSAWFGCAASVVVSAVVVRLLPSRQPRPALRDIRSSWIFPWPGFHEPAAPTATRLVGASPPQRCGDEARLRLEGDRLHQRMAFGVVERGDPPLAVGLPDHSAGLPL